MSNDPDDLRMLASQINYETAVSNGMDRWERETPQYLPRMKDEHLKPSPTKTGSWSPSSEESAYLIRSAKDEFIACRSAGDHGGMNYWDKQIRRLEKEQLEK